MFACDKVKNLKSLHKLLDENLKYTLALSKVPRIGNETAKKLIAFAGSATDVFRLSKKSIGENAEISEKLIDEIQKFNDFGSIDRELRFIENNHIDVILWDEKRYPARLKECKDAPVFLFTKGKMTLEVPKVIAIVGTRNATQYGKELCKKLIQSLLPHQPLIVSGLALGIDIAAHKEALQAGLQTVCVLGHGLDKIYPQSNSSVADKMLENGGWISEYFSGTIPDKNNFPMRNRIIAGLCDAVIVVEAAQKGGALITARIANSYNRDVFAVPGRVGDTFSQGCNYLIRTNQAAMIESGEDIEYLLGWKKTSKPANLQPKLMLDLNPEETKIVEILRSYDFMAIDDLSAKTEISLGQLSATLLTLEMKDIVASMPGKIYKLL